MREIIQNLNDGCTSLMTAPGPGLPPNGVTIRTRTTLISAGTERMLLDFGKAGWIDKARQQPDQFRRVLDKVRTDGLSATIDSVRAKLDQPVALGYSNVGVVLEIGSEVSGFSVGDRLVSNGQHAEVVSVPKNLCAKIPDNVASDAASFTVVGAIALQGIRLAQPTLGESFVVTGLGLIGLITVQLLRAHGCRVLGIDFDARKLALAQSFGAETVNLAAGEDPVAAAERFSRDRGVDGVIVTASTKSNEPIHQAALMCRKRGRIVLVGVTGLELSRDDFYKKELTFQVSCSYGPGRYDPGYEQGGNDYPYPHVRWTAQRNFEAVLDMMADGRLNVGPLITHRFLFERALDAYKLLESDEFYLGILLEYPTDTTDAALLERRIPLTAGDPLRSSTACAVGFIGAGGYATKILIPAFKKTGARLVSVASNGGRSAAHAGRRFGFEEATTDVESIMANPAIDTVVIATPHDSHATLVCRALNAGKNVFVEKPLALNPEQIDEVEETWHALPEPRLLMIGFNRRFAPLVVRAHQLLKSVKGPKALIYTINAGSIPHEHWTNDPVAGGGRIVGEACHFIDLLRFLVGCQAREVHTVRQSSDTATITITYEDDSIGTIHYFSNGNKSFPKERLDIFAAGRILVLDNFRTLEGFGWPDFKHMRLWKQNKGAVEMVASFFGAIQSGSPSPISFDELLEVTRTTLEAASR
jgi:predicted dehydrogenase/threonine dehydrogenase-like Zn-dependent dehydrogenase